MTVVFDLFLLLHLLGMALIVGAFFLQLRRTSDFVLWPTLTGAITQVVTGSALLGIAQATGTPKDLDMVAVTVKLVIGLVVLAAAIVAVVVQRRGGRVQPWFHTAGGLAVVNVIVAAFWL